MAVVDPRPAAGLDRPAAGLDRPAAGLDRPAAGLDRPAAGLDRASARGTIRQLTAWHISLNGLSAADPPVGGPALRACQALPVPCLND